jgi:threonine/homoserine/homoserine lactone efflux protein
VIQNLVAFTAAAALLTIIPGLDTALVLRTATSEGARRAVFAALGVALGLLIWGALVGLGLGALLLTSALAFDALRWLGAAYLLSLGGSLIVRPQRAAPDLPSAQAGPGSPRSSVLRGLLCNVLNPKVGLFYVSFLPQFIPQGASPAAFSLLLAAIHAALGLAWFGVLIAATDRVARSLRRPAVIGWLDRAVGCLFVGFGLRLALSARR